MLRRLPYRIQIPLGLALAVALSAFLVSVVTAHLTAARVHADIMSTVERVVAMLGEQGRPLLAQDDTWQAYTLLRSAATLLPAHHLGASRAALLDAHGRYLAGSEPKIQPTGEQALGTLSHGRLLPTPSDVTQPRTVTAQDGSLSWLQPVRSDDDEVLGFVLAEVDALAFAPNWWTLSRPALIGMALSLAVLVPIGWRLGRRMTQPIAQIARCIAAIGGDDPRAVRPRLPRVSDPELQRITGAVDRLLLELQARQAAAQRALAVERLAAVGRITAAVAHEINNPLAGLITVTQTLRLHSEDPTQRGRCIDLLERGLQQIRTMTTALLPQARVEERCLNEQDFDDVLTLATPQAEQHQVELSSTRELNARLCAPATVLRQVMLNLLLNAIKAAGPNGRVSACLSADTSKLCFFCCNTGQHLSNQALASRATSTAGDDPQGFGLWICHEIAVRFNGQFYSVSPDELSPPFVTGLFFSIPNQRRHDPQAPVTD
ncbi:MAG: hypothetical protein OHK0048_00640 [Rhodoferax sp.]